jgi:iron-regulated transporter 1
MSVYALARGAAAIAFSPSLGAWIDRGDRLNVVRASIIGQRVAVAGSCGILLALENGRDGTMRAGTDGQKGLFALVVLLGCVEKLCSVMNTVAVERDWVSKTGMRGRRWNC